MIAKIVLFSVLSLVSIGIASESDLYKKGDEIKGFAVKKTGSGYACKHVNLPLGTIVEVTAESPEKPVVKKEKIAKPVTGGSGKLSSKFGKRRCRGCSSYHKGVDYKGTNVVAALDGIVSSTGRKGNFGIAAVVDHKGPSGKVEKTTLYGHMRNCKVKHGQVVKKGQVIGTVGSTGRSTGKHLHFEISKNRKGGYDGHVGGVKENPLPYINGEKKMEVVVVEPKKSTTCTIAGRTNYGEEILAIPETVARKVGMDGEKLKEVAVTVMMLPQG